MTLSTQDVDYLHKIIADTQTTLTSLLASLPTMQAKLAEDEKYLAAVFAAGAEATELQEKALFLGWSQTDISVTTEGNSVPLTSVLVTPDGSISTGAGAFTSTPYIFTDGETSDVYPGCPTEKLEILQSSSFEGGVTVSSSTAICEGLVSEYQTAVKADESGISDTEDQINVLSITIDDCQDAIRNSGTYS